MLAGSVALEEPGEEVVLLRLPLDEQLDGHPGGTVAESHLHPPEAVAVAAGEDRAAELTDRPCASAAADVGGGDRDVVQVDRHARDSTGHRPGQVDVRSGQVVATGSGSELIAGPRPARVSSRATT